MTPGVSLVDWIAALAKPGESLLAAAKRELIEEAMARNNGVQKHAAAMLILSNIRLNGHLARMNMRPKDKKNAQPEP